MLSLFFDPSRQYLSKKQNRFLSRVEMKAYQPDDLVREHLTDILHKQQILLADVLGQTATDLPGDTLNLRSNEDAMGNLGADSLRQAAGTEIATLNNGTIRTGLRQGPVTRRDLLAVLPFQDKLFALELNSTKLLPRLGHGFAHLPEAFGGFPRISGMVVQLDPDVPAGKRVRSALVNSRHMVKTQRYSLALNNFLLQGGDNYPLPE